LAQIFVMDSARSSALARGRTGSVHRGAEDRRAEKVEHVTDESDVAWPVTRQLDRATRKSTVHAPPTDGARSDGALQARHPFAATQYPERGTAQLRDMGPGTPSPCHMLTIARLNHAPGWWMQ